MGMTEEATAQRFDKAAWAVALAAALVLNVSGWFLPIAAGERNGLDGALLVHEWGWNLVERGLSIDSAGDVFAVIFIAIGWPFHELFVLGIAILLWRPRVAVRLFAFSLGILISWQIVFWGVFPFEIGYWFWVTSFAIALWLAATNMARETIRGAVINLAKPIPLALLLGPSLIAVLTMISESHL